jgi:serine protease Do
MNMKNLKFGAFFLGLLAAVVGLVTAVDAQGTWVQAEPGRPFDFAQRGRAERPDVMMLDGRGAQLGVMVSDPSQDPQADAGAIRAGIVVDEVNPDSPAEKAGIRAGDLIVEYDGERVRSARQFTRLVQETPEGRSVSIALLRDGKRQTVNATPETGRMTWNFREPGTGSREPDVREWFRGMPNFDFDFQDRLPRRFEYRMPDGVFRFPGSESGFPSSRGRLGVSVQSITPDLAEYFGAKNGGALVSSVTPDSAASKAGLKAGDVIVSINGRGVSDSDDLLREVEDTDGEAAIVVLRDRKELTLKARIDQPGGAPPQAVPRRSRPGL